MLNFLEQLQIKVIVIYKVIVIKAEARALFAYLRSNGLMNLFSLNLFSHNFCEVQTRKMALANFLAIKMLNWMFNAMHHHSIIEKNSIISLLLSLYTSHPCDYTPKLKQDLKAQCHLLRDVILSA